MVVRSRFLFVVLLAAVPGAYRTITFAPQSFLPEDRGTVAVELFGAFTNTGVAVYFFVVPLVAGLVAAGSLAADRGCGYQYLIFARGISRTRYLLAKAAAMSVTAASATFASCVLVFAASAFFYRWRSTVVNEPSAQVGPFPDLFVAYPLLSDILVAGLLSLAAAALALTGMVAGTLVKNEYAAMAMPFLLTFGTGLIPGDRLETVQPDTYLELSGLYQATVAEPLWPVAAPTYWLVFGAMAVAISVMLFQRKESD